MTHKPRLTISNPAIGGSGYLTLGAMEADGAIAAGYHVAIHQCRGLAQAGGPLCVDVVIREREVTGAFSRQVDYVNGFELSEAWRGISAVKDFPRAFPRGLTVVADHYVEGPILVAVVRKGLRCLTRQEFIDKFKELIKAGRDLRLIVYDYAGQGFPTILKGPFSLGVITADLHRRQDSKYLAWTREAAIQGVLGNVPVKNGPGDAERLRLNRRVFEAGYEARNQLEVAEDQRVIFI